MNSYLKRKSQYASPFKSSGGIFGLKTLSKRKQVTRGKTLQSRFLKSEHREKLSKVMWTIMGFLSVGFLIGSLVFLAWLKQLTEELPDVNEPHEVFAGSQIMDRNGKELYTVRGELDSSEDLLGVDEYTPDRLKWAFLAAEDEEFYSHPGVDFTALTRCVFYKITGGPTCGGSTITQQVILNTKLARENSYTRKVKDIIMALQLEQRYSKDEILNLYMNVSPMGGGRLGVKTGSVFYFDKDLKDLKLEEMVVLAALVQQPSNLSPTVGSDPEQNKKNLHERTDYILTQMDENIDEINEKIKESNEKNKDKEGFVKQEEITADEINNAKQKVRELTYKDPVVDIKAPHFVFYVQKLLQNRNIYKADGTPFTLQEIETGGYKIYTTLDYDLQVIAEKYVSSDAPNHAGYYRKSYGAKNSAMMTMRPDTGEILTMVGSKCYKNNEYITNCKELDEKEGTQFDSDVNIMDTLQSPGSTNKPIGYYIAFRDGIISTNSMLPDVNIDGAIPGYRPRNSTPGFSGKGTVSMYLGKSANLPPLFLIDTFGVEKYINASREFGYTTYGNASGYGHSVILGGTDIKGVEHAQAYGVFANGGDLVQHEAILKIEDRDGKIIYQHKPERKRVADPAAIYLVNYALNPRTNGDSPVKSFRDIRDVAGKTGTSENNRDTWFALWSPEFVTVAWFGNNDNTRLAGNAFGSTTTEKWVGAYMNDIVTAFPNKTKFVRPEGVVATAGFCPENPEEKCVGGLGIAGKIPESYITKKSAKVCIDQPDRLARPIDEAAGFAVEKEFIYLKSPSPRLQKYVDKALGEMDGGFPSAECDIQRFEDPKKPVLLVVSPQPGQKYSGSVQIDVRSFVGEGKITKIEVYIGSQMVGSADAASFSGSVVLDNLKSGRQPFRVVAYTDSNTSSEDSFGINVSSGGSNDEPSGDIGTASMSSAPTGVAGAAVNVRVDYTGDLTVSNVMLYQKNNLTNITRYVGNMSGSGASFEANWTPATAGEYTLYAVLDAGEEGSLTTNFTTVTIAAPVPEDEKKEEKKPEENQVNNAPLEGV